MARSASREAGQRYSHAAKRLARSAPAKRTAQASDFYTFSLEKRPFSLKIGVCGGLQPRASRVGARFARALRALSQRAVGEAAPNFHRLGLHQLVARTLQDY